MVSDINFINKMRTVCNYASKLLDYLGNYIIEGITTKEIDLKAAEWIKGIKNAESACLGYNGYPAYTCISVNNVVCHGIPSERILRKGDIVNIDVTIKLDGVFGDTSKMYYVGEVSDSAKSLCNLTQKALYAAISIVKPGIRLNEIGRIIENISKTAGFSVVRDYCGHFIGYKFHELPNVLHYFADDNGFLLEEGMTFTIEPMINLGDYKVRLMRDNWTVETKDKSLSAQYEHTILVTKTGYEVLTYREEELNFIPKEG